jgi:hypothetical protein
LMLCNSLSNWNQKGFGVGRKTLLCRECRLWTVGTVGIHSDWVVLRSNFSSKVLTWNTISNVSLVLLCVLLLYYYIRQVIYPALIQSPLEKECTAIGSFHLISITFWPHPFWFEHKTPYIFAHGRSGKKWSVLNQRESRCTQKNVTIEKGKDSDEAPSKAETFIF